MSAGENITGGGQFGTDPFLLLLDHELEIAARDITVSDLALDRMDTALVLADLERVPLNSAIAVDVEDRNVGVTTLYFRKSPAPEVDVASWLWLAHGQPPRPVEIAGAHIPGTMFGDRSRLRQDYPMTFYEIQRFRSGAELPPGAPGSGYPAPEQLDIRTLAHLKTHGYIVNGPGERWYWRLPGVVHETNRVLSVRELTASDAAEN